METIDSTVDSTIQEYYTLHSLDESSVKKIIGMGKQRYRIRKLYQVAAIFIFAIGTFVGVNQYQYQSLLDATVAQIRMNHLKGEKPEIISDDYREVSEHLNKLAFAVTPSPELKDYELMGGLYCSVQGIKAAQLKLLSSSNDTATLYVCENKGVLKKLSEESETRDGVKISVWQEGDLFMGLAENIK